MKLRIPLTDLNSVVTPVFDETPDAPQQSLLPEFSFSLSPAPLSSLPDYDYSRYAHPTVRINVMLPEADRDIVSSWFGASPSGGAIPSATLVSRMTSAVTSALRQYFTDASHRALFTRPFRVGYALRNPDGSITDFHRAVLLSPSAMAPLLPVREYSLSGGVLQTVTEIINTPMMLTVDIPPFTAEGTAASPGSAIIIFMTEQADVMSGNETVSGIRTFEIFGERVPGWNYNRLAEDMVHDSALSDSRFRIVAEIALREAAAGINGMRLPDGNSDLTRWDSFPALPDSDGIEADKPASRLIISTVPLDLGYPENYKKVRGVTLRGVFTREISEDGVCFSLFGSHHREQWRHIATARGAHLRVLRGVGYRWYRLEINAPAGSQIEAATFEVNQIFD